MSYTVYEIETDEQGYQYSPNLEDARALFVGQCRDIRKQSKTEDYALFCYLRRGRLPSRSAKALVLMLMNNDYPFEMVEELESRGYRFGKLISKTVADKETVT